MKLLPVRFLKILPPFLWAGFIFYLSSIPSLRSPLGSIYFRKAAHVGVYFVLTLLIAPNFPAGKKQRIFSFLIAGIYAVIDEYHQHFVPGRVMSLMDMGYNWIGCISAYFVLFTVHSGVFRLGVSGKGAEPDREIIS